ncbi:N-alpha-acetyltransferase 25, NatB auxiliary subunit-like [Tubulanus polymorphus]|uniref:N-alpha-acetyltransferase 25, NatB auxiliary subunit-like n=1 Tax=Tubulanus polymorphus TaxID=672921 RepID=UPI003DA2DE37
MASGMSDSNSERRLRQIYDYLDNKNYKKAVSESEKILKKNKDVHCAKALKALGLLRLGKYDLSVELLREVHRLNPTDDATLQAMTICYGEMNKLDLVADMYENAVKCKPANEDLLSALFMAYVRIGSFQKQQQTAMTLHKIRPDKNPYYFWALMSIVMQAHAAKDEKKKSMFLTLAERMADKFFNGQKPEAEAEVQMYLIILELQSNYEKVLQVINSELGDRLVSELDFKSIKTAEILEKLNRWQELNSVYHQLLEHSPDAWNYWRAYIRSGLQMVLQETIKDGVIDGATTATADDACSDVVWQFITNTIDKHSSIRGPYLAQLEYIHQHKQQQHLTTITETMFSLIVKYIQRFGTKFCCFEDVKIYFDDLTKDEQKQVIFSMMEEIGLNSDLNELKYPTDVKQMQLHLTILQLERYIDLHQTLNVTEKVSLVQQFSLRFQDAIRFGKDLLPTDYQPGDLYLILAALLLYDLWIKTDDVMYIWKNIILLESGLKSSPSNFRVKIILIRLYCIIGAFSPAYSLFESLEIKHIQYDTLGYLVHSHAARLGHLACASFINNMGLKFFSSNYKDTSDYLISSYKYGSFSKINEFVKFQQRLQKSVQFASYTAEELMIELLTDTNETDQHTNESLLDVDPENDETNWEELIDNRDFQVLNTCDNINRSLTPELQLDSFNEEKVWLKCRNLTVRILSGITRVTVTPSTGVTKAATVAPSTGNSMQNGSGDAGMIAVIQRLINELRSHLQQIGQIYSQPKQYPLTGPYRTRISAYLYDCIGDLFIDCVGIVFYAVKLREDGLDNLHEVREIDDNSLCKNLHKLVTKYKSSLTSNNEHEFNAEHVEHLTLITELFAQVVYVLKSCDQILSPLIKTSSSSSTTAAAGGSGTAAAAVGNSRKNKRKQKEKELPKIVPEVIKVFSDYITSIETIGRTLLQSIKLNDIQISIIDFSNLKIHEKHDKNQLDSLQNEISSKIKTSFTESINELSEFVNAKLNELSILKQSIL